MNTDRPESPMIAGLEPPTPATGQLERMVFAQIEALRRLGYVEAHHVGLCELALVTARDIDRSFGRGAPSGRANLLRVMNEVLEALPQPEAASRDALDDVVAAILAGDDEDVDVRA